jgi:hypothetical protein
MLSLMSGEIITALATVLLVIVGFAQVGVLIAQRYQSQIALIEEYRQRWSEYKNYWGAIVFIGRNDGEYYQVVDQSIINKFISERDNSINNAPSVWALDAVRSVCGTLSDICTKILQGQLDISYVYPIFGTELLRHSRPLRILLDANFHGIIPGDKFANIAHQKLREEVQDWLIYHEGIRRRCLILIDLLWSEATRLEDLPPSDLISAADAKKISGKLNRNRLFIECLRLNGYLRILLALKLSRFLKHSEYRCFKWGIGISANRLKKLDKEWTARLFRKY